MQSIQLALEDSRKKVEEQLVEAQTRLTSADQSHKRLQNQLQESLEEQRRLAITHHEKSARQVKSGFHTIDVLTLHLSLHFVWLFT